MKVKLFVSIDTLKVKPGNVPHQLLRTRYKLQPILIKIKRKSHSNNAEGKSEKDHSEIQLECFGELINLKKIM